MSVAVARVCRSCSATLSRYTVGAFCSPCRESRPDVAAGHDARESPPGPGPSERAHHVPTAHLVAFGRRLASLREQRRLNQSMLARRAGCSPRALNFWEQGHREPSAGMLMKLADALDVSMDELWRGTGTG